MLVHCFASFDGGSGSFRHPFAVPARLIHRRYIHIGQPQQSGQPGSVKYGNRRRGTKCRRCCRGTPGKTEIANDSYLAAS